MRLVLTILKWAAICLAFVICFLLVAPYFDPS